MSSRAGVIVPLYQYPVDQSTWTPLLEQILSHTHLHFIIIVNPDSGPGLDQAGWLPDSSYDKALSLLNVCSNVQMVGYVRLDYCRRDFSDVETDVRKYANWSSVGSTAFAKQSLQRRFGVDGVFFDETPNLFDEAAANYLASVGALVKTSQGILSNRLVIHNPGTPPDPEYGAYWNSVGLRSCATWRTAQTYHSPDPTTSADANFQLHSMGHIDDAEIPASPTFRGAPDIVVVFEQSFAHWRDAGVQQRMKDLVCFERKRCAYMVHSVPLSTVSSLTQELIEKGKYVYITDLCEKYYEAWGIAWRDFVDAMDVQ